MPEPDTPEPPEPRHVPSRDEDEWPAPYRALPLRALVAFTLRCTKRVEPLFRLAQLRAEAYSAGLDVSMIRCHGGVPSAAYAAFAAEAHTDADADIAKLLSLNLGKPGEPGEPIRWNDPRLGPLW